MEVVNRLFSIENRKLDDMVYPEKIISNISAGFWIDYVGIMNDSACTVYISSASLLPGAELPQDVIKIGAFQTKSFPIKSTTNINLKWTGDPRPGENNISIFLSNQPVELYGATFDPTVTNQKVTVTGNVSVDNFPDTQTVDGTVNVGNFPATQAVSGSVNVGNLPEIQTVSLTDSIPDMGGDPALIGRVMIDGIPTVTNKNAVNKYRTINTTTTVSLGNISTLDSITVTKPSSSAQTLTVNIPAWNGDPSSTITIDMTKTGTYHFGISKFGLAGVPVSVTHSGDDASAGCAVVTYTGG